LVSPHDSLFKKLFPVLLLWEEGAGARKNRAGPFYSVSPSQIRFSKTVSSVVVMGSGSWGAKNKAGPEFRVARERATWREDGCHVGRTGHVADRAKRCGEELGERSSASRQDYQPFRLVTRKHNTSLGEDGLPWRRLAKG